MKPAVAGLFAVIASACTCGGAVVPPPPRGDDGGVTACIDGASALALSPLAPSVDLSAPAPLKFTASATLKDGTTRDATAAVNWSASRADGAPAGAVAQDGSFTPAPGVGGVVTVTATDGCVSASTDVTVKLGTVVFNDPGPAVTGRFGGTVVTGNTAKAPLIVYPNTETRFPVNIYKVLFQWRKSGNDYFRLTFDGPGSKTVVYSDGAHPQCAKATPPAGCYESSLPAWQAIAASNAGQVVTLTIDGVAPGDANVYQSASIQLGFSRQPVRGAIFYWSTTAAGIRRATVSDSDPEPYAVAKPTPTVLPRSGAVKCVACHTVSRDGTKMIAATQAATASSVFVYDVTAASPPNDFINAGVSRSGHEFGTLSPDNKRAVATNAGALGEYDVTGAGPLGAKLVDLPLNGGKATHPDWSPKGSELVYATGAGDGPSGAGLSVISYLGSGSWGAIRQLAPPNGKTNLFPSYSPDGDWVAYSRGTKGGHGDVTTQLMVIKADGSQGGAGVELVRANRWVNNQVTTGQFENNQPTWAPPGDLHWVAFNSLRPYGVVFPTGGTQQIWVAAVDPAQLDGGVDPSFPAFRFSFQGLNENNHRAFWTLDVRVPDGGIYIEETPGDGGVCLPDGAACNQTSGAGCCAPTYCDFGADGGTVCQVAPIN